MFESVDADHGASFGELRIREQREQPAEVAEHVRFVEAWDPARKIESIRHVISRLPESSVPTVIASKGQSEIDK